MHDPISLISPPPKNLRGFASIDPRFPYCAGDPEYSILDTRVSMDSGIGIDWLVSENMNSFAGERTCER